MTIQYFPAQFNIFPYLLNCLLYSPIKGGGGKMFIAILALVIFDLRPGKTYVEKGLV